MNKIKIWDMVEDVDTVKKNADKLGLSDIPDIEYSLKKVGEKNPNPYGIESSGIMSEGQVYLVGNKDYVWLYVTGMRFNGWFKTSPILKVEPTETGYKFETENSFYELNKI